MNGSNARQQASLRYLDWRFLLPNPPAGVFHHLVLLGGSAGLAERIVEIGLARRVSCKTTMERSADAVIILHDAQVPLSNVADCLMPGGVVYLEVDRRLSWSAASSPRRVWRDLQNVGLSSTGTYLASPDFARRQVYLPLDVPGALGWYLRTFFTATTPALRLLGPVLRNLARLGKHPPALLAPCYAMTAIAGPTRDTPPSVLGHPALPPEFRRSDLRPLVLTPGKDDFNRVVMLPFAPDGNQPVGVLKLSRLPDRNILTEEEQIALTAIRTNLDAAMRRTIPQPLGTLRWGQLSVGIESCAPGRLLSTSTGRWGTPLRQKIADLHRAVAWLTELHCQAQIKRSQWGSSELGEWVEKPLAAYEQAFGVTASEQRLFAAVRRRANSLVGIPVPTVLVHWNFSMDHVFRAGHDITVVDWEGVVPGPFLLDLLFFAMRWSYTVRHLHGDDAQLRGFRDLFCDSRRTDSVTTAVYQAITQYMTRLGIDPRFLPFLLVIMCVLRGLGRFNRREGAGEQGENARAGNQYVGYIGVLAEHIEQLFAETYGK
jgi:hypothetical protein